jgi:phosphoribosylformylglycinamidine synthase subunit PurL
VTLAEGCISHHPSRGTPHLRGAQIDLSEFKDVRLDALLFGETQSRVVITVAAIEAVKVLERAKILGVPAARIGTVGGDQLCIKTASGEWQWPIAELEDVWWNSIARVM